MQRYLEMSFFDIVSVAEYKPFEELKVAQAPSHLTPHLHPCRFSSPVFSWTIAMFSLGWTGGATKKEL